jgi:hypothetical protein
VPPGDNHPFATLDQLFHVDLGDRDPWTEVQKVPLEPTWNRANAGSATPKLGTWSRSPGRVSIAIAMHSSIQVSLFCSTLATAPVTSRRKGKLISRTA